MRSAESCPSINAIEDLFPIGVGADLCGHLHLLVDCIVYLRSILEKEDLSGALEEPLNLVTVLPHEVGRQLLFRPLPLKANATARRPVEPAMIAIIGYPFRAFVSSLRSRSARSRGTLKIIFLPLLFCSNTPRDIKSSRSVLAVWYTTL